MNIVRMPINWIRYGGVWPHGSWLDSTQKSMRQQYGIKLRCRLNVYMYLGTIVSHSSISLAAAGWSPVPSFTRLHRYVTWKNHQDEKKWILLVGKLISVVAETINYVFVFTISFYYHYFRFGIGCFFVYSLFCCGFRFCDCFFCTWNRESLSLSLVRLFSRHRNQDINKWNRKECHRYPYRSVSVEMPQFIEGRNGTILKPKLFRMTLMHNCCMDVSI